VAFSLSGQRLSTEVRVVQPLPEPLPVYYDGLVGDNRLIHHVRGRYSPGTTAGGSTRGDRWESSHGLRLTKALVEVSIALVTASRPVLNSPESRYDTYPTTNVDVSTNAFCIAN
jgi:hypothetical protein